MEASQNTGGSLETGNDLAKDGTRAWLRPAICRLDAGSAEIGGNTTTPDSFSDVS